MRRRAPVTVTHCTHRPSHCHRALQDHLTARRAPLRYHFACSRAVDPLTAHCSATALQPHPPARARTLSTLQLPGALPCELVEGLALCLLDPERLGRLLHDRVDSAGQPH